MIACALIIFLKGCALIIGRLQTENDRKEIMLMIRFRTYVKHHHPSFNTLATKLMHRHRYDVVPTKRNIADVNLL
jgi:hypothetical protein